MLTIIAQADASGFLTQTEAFFTFVTTHWQFCLLHFLEFAIWGAWIVVLGNLLNARGFSRKEIGSIYACMPIGSMITPLFIGPLADKLFNTEVIIGVSHLLGAVLLFMMAKAKNPRPFYWLTLLYALAYSPTLGLANSIVFAHNDDIFGGLAGEGFPWIRVFGTCGWIAAGLSHALILKKGEPVNERPLLLACGLSIILGLFAFTLPATPPKAALASADAVAGEEVKESALDAASSILQGSFEMLTMHPVFFAVTFVAAMAMGLYFAFAALFLEKTGVPARTVGPVMTIGQWIEIFFMLTLPWFLGKDNANMNWVLLTGICAWFVRFGLFAIGKPLPMVLFGIAIHGICFDFFFAAGFINADMIAPESLTATAQTLYGFLVYGLGMYLGSIGSGWLNQYFSKPETAEDGTVEIVTNWRAFWAVPCAIVFVGAVLFLTTLG
jgi:nucleoside transporter